MSWDITARMIDYIERQIEALEAAARDWEPLCRHEGAFSDEDLDRIEEIQSRHARILNPLHAEFVCLQREWERSGPDDGNREAVQERARKASALADRVQAMEKELANRIGAQAQELKPAALALRRGRKMTRDYGTSRPDDARHVDRQA